MSDSAISIEEAKAIIQQGESAEVLDLIIAAGCIMDHCEDSDAVTIADILRCLPTFQDYQPKYARGHFTFGQAAMALDGNRQKTSMT